MLPDAATAEVVGALYASVRRGNCAAVTGDFAELVGRAPRTLDETYRERSEGS